MPPILRGERRSGEAERGSMARRDERKGKETIIKGGGHKGERTAGEGSDRFVKAVIFAEGKKREKREREKRVKVKEKEEMKKCGRREKRK